MLLLGPETEVVGRALDPCDPRDQLFVLFANVQCSLLLGRVYRLTAAQLPFEAMVVKGFATAEVSLLDQIQLLVVPIHLCPFVEH